MTSICISNSMFRFFTFSRSVCCVSVCGSSNIHIHCAKKFKYRLPYFFLCSRRLLSQAHILFSFCLTDKLLEIINVIIFERNARHRCRYIRERESESKSEELQTVMETNVNGIKKNRSVANSNIVFQLIHFYQIRCSVQRITINAVADNMACNYCCSTQIL